MANVRSFSSATKAVWGLTRDNSGLYRLTLSTDSYPYGEVQLEVRQLLIDDLAGLSRLLDEELARRHEADSELELGG